MRDRNHEYRYTVDTRHEFDKPVTDADGNVIKTIKVTEWLEVQVKAFNIRDVADKLHLSLDDVRFKHKEILK